MRPDCPPSNCKLPGWVCTLNCSKPKYCVCLYKFLKLCEKNIKQPPSSVIEFAKIVIQGTGSIMEKSNTSVFQEFYLCLKRASESLVQMNVSHPWVVSYRTGQAWDL